MKSKRHHRRGTVRTLAALAFVLLSTAIASRADAFGLFYYKFTPIADTKDGFPFQSLNAFPVIASGGRVAFIATLTGGNVAA
jgi:hypothetical protein